LRSNRDGRFDSAGSRRSKWFVVPICVPRQMISRRRSKKHQEEPVVIFQPINLVKEERAVLIGDERVDIFEHEHARSFGAGTLEDLPDTYGRMVRSHVGDKTRRP